MKNYSIVQKMKRHRVAIIILLIIIGLFFTTSSVNELKFMLGGEGYREAKIETIIMALQNEDVRAIKNLLSKATIESVGEDKIEEDIRYLFTEFHGEVLSIDMRGGGFSESIRGINRSRSSTLSAYVTTDFDVYRVAGPDEIYNSFNRKDVGLSKLMVLNKEDYDRIGSPARDFVGIFRQDIVLAALDKYSPDKNSLEVVIEALQNNDSEAITGMFSQRAISEVGLDKIKAGARYSCNMHKGNVVSLDPQNAEIFTNIIDGKVQRTLEMICYVYTDNSDYTLFYREHIVDEVSPENIGIDRLQIKRDGGSGSWPLKDALGIFCPENRNPREYTSWKSE